VKSSQLKEMNILDLQNKLNENIESLQNLRFQKVLQQLEDFTSISKLRKEIAQLKTVLNELELGIRNKEGG
tara:strand:+ start:490 stop:702 length:213 start_codon:yes stop_codon:yes gene_type:complete